MFAKLAPILLTSMLLLSCATPEFTKLEREEVFAQAVEASLNENPALSAAAAFNYLQGASPDDPRYDRALRLLANAAEQLNLSYAASLWYLDIAKSRRDPTLVSESVRGIERILLNYPSDVETLLKGFIATGEITGLNPEQQAFVSYHQGMDSLRKGLDDWATQKFASIPEASPYYLRAEYVRVVGVVARYDLVGARDELLKLAEAENIPPDLKLDVYRTLARIAFERQRFKEALRYYELIRADAPNDPSLLLEMAWAHYYRGEYQRSLGLLLALDAPSYGGLIAPERYMLEALALRKICQFEPAQRAAVRLRGRHGDAIDDLYAGVPLQKSKALRRAARQRADGRPISLYRARLARERKMLDDLEGQLGKKLVDGMRQIYDHGVAESQRREDEQLEQEMIAVSNELLGAEEGVRLILHELGVALLRGRRRNDAFVGVEAQAKIDNERQIQYTFEGEFWTDELDDLVVKMEDRCID